MAGTILQQTFVVEYVVNHQMCDDCRRVEAKDTWNASVSFICEIRFGKNFRIALSIRIFPWPVFGRLFVQKFF